MTINLINFPVGSQGKLALSLLDFQGEEMVAGSSAYLTQLLGWARNLGLPWMAARDWQQMPTQLLAIRWVLGHATKVAGHDKGHAQVYQKGGELTFWTMCLLLPRWRPS